MLTTETTGDYVPAQKSLSQNPSPSYLSSGVKSRLTSNVDPPFFSFFFSFPSRCKTCDSFLREQAFFLTPSVYALELLLFECTSFVAETRHVYQAGRSSGLNLK
jgi:hypothetical protein